MIGRGRLVADTSVAELLAAAAEAGSCCARRGRYAMTVLANAGATVAATGDDRSPCPACRRADRRPAAADGIPFSELTPARASLEEAYMEMTR